MRNLLLTLFAAVLAAACWPQQQGKNQPPPSAGAGANAAPAAPPTAEELPFVDTAWRLARADGATLAARLVLRAGGRIEGHAGADEASWGVADGALVFKNSAGAVATRFDRIARSLDNRDVLLGTFAPDASVTPVLTREEGAALIDAARAACAIDANVYSVKPDNEVAYRLAADPPAAGGMQAAARRARVPAGGVMRLAKSEVQTIVSAGATRFDAFTHRIPDAMLAFNICAE